MTDPLAQFRDTYITECLELLASMEEELMELDASASREKLDAIFRCAHSIKGGAGAFGFTAIQQFTHVLEALLDQLREGKLTISRELTDLLLRARDVVLEMVIAARDHKTLGADFGHTIEQELKTAISGPSSSASKLISTISSANSGSGHKNYDIIFTPQPALLANGNEPLLLLRELASLGDAAITCDISKIPALDAMNPEQCYLSWQISLNTDQNESRIREVFEFVEDECALIISSPLRGEDGREASSGTEQLSPSPHPSSSGGGSVAPEPTEQTHPMRRASDAAGTPSSIRVDIEKIDRLINMVGEIVIIQGMLTMRSRQILDSDVSELTRGIDEMMQYTRELQEAVMAVRMQPVKSIFSRMPRIVRDLSAQLGKDIRLEMSGEATEVDKTIIEQLSDPLTHMIRNSVDHGIESPERRKAAGKRAQGVIHLSAEHRGGKIVLTIGDDGGGINRERVLQKAKEKQIVAPDAQLTDEQIDALIFAPGFSTAEKVTNVSGRGVGMDVVKRNIEGLGGSVAVHNRPGKGSQFIISLPLTLAILDGMVVRVAEEHYIVPIANIVETLRPRAEEVRHVADGNIVINVRGEFIPVLYLHRLFNISGAQGDASKALVILVENGDHVIGLVVDELVGQQQVVIKSLEENSDPIAGVSGATILGDGKVSLILDIAGLHRMQHHEPLTLPRAA